MADMDQGIKRILQARPADILRLALPDAQYLGPIETDVATEPQLVLDSAHRVRYEGVETVVNVEAQAYPDPGMPRRSFEYGSRASIVHQLPALSVVLWLLPGRKAPEPFYIMQIGSLVQATWRIINIELYNITARDIVASGSLGLLPLVPFMRGSDLALAEAAAREMKQQAEPKLAGDLISLLAVFLARFEGEAAARELVRSVLMSTELLDESPLYRAWREEARQRGLTEGLAEGRAEGIEEGRAEGVRAGLRVALTVRFGALDAETLAQVNAARLDALDAALARVADASLDEIRTLLSQPGA